MVEDKKYLKAKKRVKEIKSFYTHLTVFLIILGILTIINVSTFIMHPEQRNLWFLFPMGFWGFAVLMHALRTFLIGPGSSWEKRKIKEVMGKMDKDS